MLNGLFKFGFHHVSTCTPGVCLNSDQTANRKKMSLLVQGKGGGAIFQSENACNNIFYNVRRTVRTQLLWLFSLEIRLCLSLLLFHIFLHFPSFNLFGAAETWNFQYTPLLLGRGAWPGNIHSTGHESLKKISGSNTPRCWGGAWPEWFCKYHDKLNKDATMIITLGKTWQNFYQKNDRSLFGLSTVSLAS